MQKIDIAKLGRSVGLKGELKIYLLTDFPEQFKRGSKFKVDDKELIVEYYSPKRGVIKFRGIDEQLEAKKLTNKIITSTIEETKKNCQLNKDEFFWFDVIGCEVFENGKKIGKIKEIQRLPSSDYIIIETAKELIKDKKAKSFMLPFIDKFIEDVDIESKKIFVKDALDILDAS